MRTGFVIEAHTVIRCDGCGDLFSENGCQAACFGSTNQAVAYITARTTPGGWVYDGDRVLCDGCTATAECQQHGHTFPESRRWPLADKNRPRTCSRCGISDTEIEE
ncbi:hypothetical protein [Nocardia terpenica]|uniref:Uncharacterized protein n=1 Tax=Nocardia terpenica TaxID=455432 RepID=A0A164ME75_9NOCA|nr:hypothetical protein [Nocardia terpenica]KZM73280.1 hypothetical protein AWN90_31955 [Nocardia terpenica]NQE87574.1 hypothetical protein [Nocardia terpenica]